MENNELHVKFVQTITECWDAYEKKILALPPKKILAKAFKISAMRYCCEELTDNAASYPECYLEHLLKYQNPLRTAAEQWMSRCGWPPRNNPDMEYTLWSLWCYEPEPENVPFEDFEEEYKWEKTNSMPSLPKR